MSREDDRMRMLVAGYRRAIAPRANDRARVWERLEDDTEQAPAPVVSSRRTVAIAITCAIAAALLLFALRPSARTSATAHERDDGHSVYDANAEPSTQATTPVAPERSLPPPEPVATPLVEPAAPPVASPRKRPPTQRPTVSTDDPLRDELRIIEAARAALDRDDHDGALALLREHGRRHPSGALVLEARSLRAITLCEAGRSMQGRGEARTLLQERTSSPYRARLREACDLR